MAFANPPKLVEIIIGYIVKMLAGTIEEVKVNAKG
jgi:hypothetical protein